MIEKDGISKYGISKYGSNLEINLKNARYFSEAIPDYSSIEKDLFPRLVQLLLDADDDVRGTAVQIFLRLVDEDEKSRGKFASLRALMVSSAPLLWNSLDDMNDLTVSTDATLSLLRKLHTAGFLGKVNSLGIFFVFYFFSYLKNIFLVGSCAVQAVLFLEAPEQVRACRLRAAVRRAGCGLHRS